MKILKGSLFLLAILVASLAAINPIKAKNSPKKAVAGLVWLKFDCTNGQPLGGTTGTQTVVTQDPEEVCADGNEIRCAAEYVFEAQASATNQHPVILGTDGEYRFNPDYVAGQEAAIDDIEQDIKCPEL